MKVVSGVPSPHLTVTGQDVASEFESVNDPRFKVLAIPVVTSWFVGGVTLIAATVPLRAKKV